MMPLPPNMTRSIMHSASEAGGSAQENLLRQLVGAVPDDDRAPLLAAMLDQLGEGTDGLARLFRAAIAQRGGADAAEFTGQLLADLAGEMPATMRGRALGLAIGGDAVHEKASMLQDMLAGMPEGEATELLRELLERLGADERAILLRQLMKEMAPTERSDLLRQLVGVLPAAEVANLMRCTRSRARRRSSRWRTRCSGD